MSTHIGTGPLMNQDMTTAKRKWALSNGDKHELVTAKDDLENSMLVHSTTDSTAATSYTAPSGEDIHSHAISQFPNVHHAGTVYGPGAAAE